MQYGATWFLAALTTSLFAPVALAQVPQPGEGLVCPNQRAAVGDLGYDVLACNCSHFVDPENPSRSYWEFRSEPMVERATRGGPPESRLQSGDVIVAIDGYLITTAEGGHRFAQVTPGKPVRLTVRRGDREVDVVIEPSAVCPPDRPAAPRAPLRPGVPGAPVVAPVPPPFPRPDAPGAPRAATAPAPALPPPPPSVLPPGWLGLSLSCSVCGIHLEGRDRAWTFSTPPLVESVEPESPAFVAGVRSGDRLTHIDGLSFTSAEGGRRFAALRAGERVRLRVERDGAQRETELVVGERRSEAPAPPTAPSPGAPAPTRGGVVARAPQPSTVRFTGFVGNAFVQVTGGPVTITETEEEVVIRSSDITVRIRKTESGEVDRR